METTRHFLELFNLKDIKDLPRPEEIMELGEEVGKEEQAEEIENQVELEDTRVLDGEKEEDQTDSDRKKT